MTGTGDSHLQKWHSGRSSSYAHRLFSYSWRLWKLACLVTKVYWLIDMDLPCCFFFLAANCGKEATPDISRAKMSILLYPNGPGLPPARGKKWFCRAINFRFVVEHSILASVWFFELGEPNTQSTPFISLFSDVLHCCMFACRSLAKPCDCAVWHVHRFRCSLRDSQNLVASEFCEDTDNVYFLSCQLGQTIPTICGNKTSVKRKEYW